MKTQFIMIAATTLIGLSAMAEGETAITCHFKNNSIFKMYINAEPLENLTTITAQSPAVVDIGGPRLHMQYQKTLIVKPITTRITVGTSYYIDLGNDASISLSDIDFAPANFEHLIGFTGTYSDQGHVIELICKMQL